MESDRGFQLNIIKKSPERGFFYGYLPDDHLVVDFFNTVDDPGMHVDTRHLIFITDSAFQSDIAVLYFDFDVGALQHRIRLHRLCDAREMVESS